MPAWGRYGIRPDFKGNCGLVRAFLPRQTTPGKVHVGKVHLVVVGQRKLVTGWYKLEDSRLLSVVVPVLNEQAILRDSYETLTGVLERLGRPFEVIIVDNGSTDATAAIAANLCRRDPRCRYIRLSRNFGYQNSITAGMLAAQGEAIVVIDADLQDPPELIAEFVSRWQQGYEVVYGVREKRIGEPRWRILPTMLAMRVLTWMSDDGMLPAHSADFRLISRRVRDEFARLPEANRYVRGMIHWLGFRQIGIPYTRRGRSGGYSKANWLFLIGFTFNALFNVSVKPLRFFGMLGAGVLGLAFVLAAACLVLGLSSSVLLGPIAIFLLLLVNLGVNSLGIGILGEYLGKVYAESKRRPLWLVDYTINLKGPATPWPDGERPSVPGPEAGRTSDPPLAA
jgi:dolichol-phosphate mannosyltransferase